MAMGIVIAPATEADAEAISVLNLEVQGRARYGAAFLVQAPRP
jgi:hypothetical protein